MSRRRNRRDHHHPQGKRAGTAKDTRLRSVTKSVAKVFVVPVILAPIVALVTGFLDVPSLIDRVRPGDPVAVNITDVGTGTAAAPQRLDSLSWQKVIQSRDLAQCSGGFGKSGLPGAPLIPAERDVQQLALTARRSRVTITSLSVRVLRHDKPLTGALFYVSPALACGGHGGPGSFEADEFQSDLDATPVKLERVESGLSVKRTPAAKYVLPIDDGHTVPLWFRLWSTSGSWTWDVKMSVTVRGASQVIYVGSNGIVHGNEDPAPFVFTALAPHAGDYGVIYGRGYGPPKASPGFISLTPEELCATNGKPLICGP